MGKKILLTGATGFTGRHFIKHANEQGYECVALCHRDIGAIEGCEQLVVSDLADKEQLKSRLANINPDYVLHLAAISFVDHGNVGDIYRTNVLGTINLLDCLIELNVNPKKVIVASSGNVYGNSRILPINESLATSPVNDYAASKCAMELAVRIRYDKLPIVLVRPFNYTGVGQAEHFLIPKIVGAFKRKQASIELGNLDVARDFSDVRDIVRAYLKLMTSNTDAVHVNICTGKATSLLSIIDWLNQIAGYEIEVNVNPDFVRANEIKQLYGTNQMLIDIIGDYQQYEFTDTLKWMYGA